MKWTGKSADVEKVKGFIAGKLWVLFTLKGTMNQLEENVV